MVLDTLLILPKLYFHNLQNVTKISFLGFLWELKVTAHKMLNKFIIMVEAIEK